MLNVKEKLKYLKRRRALSQHGEHGQDIAKAARDVFGNARDTIGLQCCIPYNLIIIVSSRIIEKHCSKHIQDVDRRLQLRKQNSMVSAIVS